MAQPRPNSAPGFDTKLDYTNLDELSESEAAGLLSWSDNEHGDGTPGLTEFVSFFITHRPRALKLYRAYAQSLHDTGGLPQVIVAILFLRYYMSVGNSNGVLYEVVAARQWGATKAEVLDAIESGFVVSGPFGGNAAAGSSEYLQNWNADEPRRTANPWPSAWADRRPVDETPSTAELFGRRAPQVWSALLERRLRVNNGIENLPPIMPVLFDLHRAVADGRPVEAARSAQRAFAAGMTSQELLEIVGFGALYATVDQLETVAEALEPVFTRNEAN
jgi:alkylhydroperoxidase/carboxymuconolactone decarboxylase family protein YurZ